MIAISRCPERKEGGKQKGRNKEETNLSLMNDHPTLCHILISVALNVSSSVIVLRIPRL